MWCETADVWFADLIAEYQQYQDSVVDNDDDDEDLFPDTDPLAPQTP
jgi:hypothetical protein